MIIESNLECYRRRGAGMPLEIACFEIARRPLPAYAAHLDLTPLRRLARDLHRRIVCFDIESTTLINDRDFGIVEFGATIIERSGEVTTASTMVNPGLPIHPAASAVTGLHDNDVLGAPRFNEIAQSLRSLFANAIVCGHFIDRFDLRGIDRECARFNVAPICGYQNVDTVNYLSQLSRGYGTSAIDRLARRLRLSCAYRSRSLVAVAAHLGINLPGRAHRAVYDSLLAAGICCEIIERLGSAAFLGL